MTLTVEAVYENGVLRPAQPLPLQERERVQVTITSPVNWVQETAGMMGWQGTSEELSAFALDAEFEYPPPAEEP